MATNLSISNMRSVVVKYSKPTGQFLYKFDIVCIRFDFVKIFNF